MQNAMLLGEGGSAASASRSGHVARAQASEALAGLSVFGPVSACERLWPKEQRMSSVAARCVAPGNVPSAERKARLPRENAKHRPNFGTFAAGTTAQTMASSSTMIVRHLVARRGMSGR